MQSALLLSPSRPGIFNFPTAFSMLNAFHLVRFKVWSTRDSEILKSKWKVSPPNVLMAIVNFIRTRLMQAGVARLYLSALGLGQHGVEVALLKIKKVLLTFKARSWLWVWIAQSRCRLCYAIRLKTRPSGRVKWMSSRAQPTVVGPMWSLSSAKIYQQMQQIKRKSDNAFVNKTSPNS